MNLDPSIKALSKELVSRYYSSQSFDYNLLEPLKNREYAYFDFEGNCHRGLVFITQKEIENFIRKTETLSFHSSVHAIINPWSTKKNTKRVLKVCIVLDFDISRIANDFSFQNQVALLKRIQQLIQIVLVGEFNINPNYLHLYFSGSKGFHLYITDPNFTSLVNTFESLQNFLALIRKKPFIEGDIVENDYTLNWRAKGVFDDLHLDTSVSTDLNKLIKSPFSLNRTTFLKSFSIGISEEITPKDLLIRSIPNDYEGYVILISLTSEQTLLLPNGEKFILNEGENEVPGYIFLWLYGMKVPFSLLSFSRNLSK